jgi:hypothetical protein
MLVSRCSSQLSSHQNPKETKKVTASERSASQMNRVTQRLGKVALTQTLKAAVFIYGPTKVVSRYNA